MNTKNRLSKTTKRSGRSRNLRNQWLFKPNAEALEPRHLLAGFLQGTAFFDTNGNAQLDLNEGYKPGATIFLQNADGTPAVDINSIPVAPAITDANGQYRFDNLASGIYHLVEIPIPGYVNAGTQILSQFNPAEQVSLSTIEVTLVDFNSVFLNYLSLGQTLNTEFDFTDPSTPLVTQHPIGSTGQIIISLGDSLEPFPGNSDLSNGPFVSYCLDLINGLQTFGGEQFQVIPMPTSALPPSGDPGRVAFLYNHFGLDPTLTTAQYAGLQLALWELTYDASGDLTTGFFRNVSDYGAGAIAEANAFLALSVGKSEVAVYLNSAAANPDTHVGHQGMIATESFNFANKRAELPLPVDANITITPSQTNEVGVPHTFTVTVMKDTGDGSGLVPAAGEHADFTLTNSNGAAAVLDATASTCDDAGANLNAAGQCTIVFVSPTAGQVTGNASTSLSFPNGANPQIVVARDTNPATATVAGPGGSGPAVKTYVDANIVITPPQTNEVGQPHTFTVTVKKDTGDGSGLVPAAGEHADFTLTNSNGAAAVLDATASTCDDAGANLNAAGQCTIVFASATAGQVTGNAAVVLTVGGVLLARDTNPATATVAGPGGSGPAVKTYVDANIVITPPNSTNPTGTPHTFTITVTAFPGGASPVVFNSIIPTISPAPSSQSNTCAAPTINANAATCTVTINSNTAGVFTANATAVVTLGGVSVTRDTNPVTATIPAGPGGSGPATKTYKKPGIDIEKTTTGSPNGNPIAPDYDNEDATNGPGVPLLTPGTTVTWTYKVTNTGGLPYAKNDVLVTDDNGTPGDTADDMSTTNGKITFLNVQTGDADTDLEPNEVWLYKATGIVQNFGASGGSNTFDFSGNSALKDTAGNIRTFTAGGVSVKTSAFSRDSSGNWATAYLGSYGGGLGVTDGSEDGNNNTHTVDNNGRKNYVLFEFSQFVVVDSAFLGFVAGDSDLKAWIGTRTDPFNNHLTLSDDLLSSLGSEVNSTPSGLPRAADLNAGLVSGNVLVIAADPGDLNANDYFKIETLTLAKGCYENKAVVTGLYGTNDSDLSHYCNSTTPPVGSLSGRKFKDLTGNGKSADDTLLSGTKIYVDMDNDGMLDSGEPSAVTNASGVYTINNVPTGTYKVREVVPSGMVRTGPALFNYHTVTVAAGQTATVDNGYPGNPPIAAGPIDFYNAEKCDSCILSSFSFAVTHDGVTTIVSDLRGNTHEGDTVKVTFTVPAGPSRQISFVTYTAPSGVWDASIASQQTIFQQGTGTSGASGSFFAPGTHTLTVTIPKWYYQIDFVCGLAIDKLGPVGSNIFYSSQNRLFSADNGGVNALGSPAIDLSLTKTVDNATQNLGSNVKFTIVVNNAAGWSSATGVHVQDLLPSAGYTFVSSTVTQGTYDKITGDWNVGTLTPSATTPATATLTITATVNTSGAKNNAAQVSAANQPDIDSSKNNDNQPTVRHNEDDDDNVSVTPCLWTKFFVVDDNSTDRTYQYASDGTSRSNYTLNNGNTGPRGVATTAAATKLWVIDTNKKVYIYNVNASTGAVTYSGYSWTPYDPSGKALVDPQGITTDGTNIWIVDGGTADKVYKYASAASRTSGTMNAAALGTNGSFALKNATGAVNTNPKDLVTDGTSIWVVDDGSTTDKVFKYSTSSSYLGNWTITTSGASSPTGITLNPSKVSELWIVDVGTDKIYQYDAAAGRIKDNQSASTWFALTNGNSCPQGIADPPPAESGQPMELAAHFAAAPASDAAVDAALQELLVQQPSGTDPTSPQQQASQVYNNNTQTQGSRVGVLLKRSARLGTTEFGSLSDDSLAAIQLGSTVLVDDVLVDAVLATWQANERTAAIRRWNS